MLRKLRLTEKNGKCGKEGKKLQKVEYFESKKSSLDEIKNTFHSF